MTRYKQDDISLLLPTMAAKVKEVLDKMTALGFQPVLFDGLRTPAEALKNAAKGVGIVNSMHLYGCAADVICDQHGWTCADQRCKFFTKLVETVKSMGFVSGADFHDAQGRPKVDLPHFQAVTIADQHKMAALGTAADSISARDALVQAFFKH